MVRNEGSHLVLVRPKCPSIVPVIQPSFSCRRREYSVLRSRFLCVFRRSSSRPQAPTPAPAPVQGKEGLVSHPAACVLHAIDNATRNASVVSEGPSSSSLLTLRYSRQPPQTGAPAGPKPFFGVSVLLVPSPRGNQTSSCSGSMQLDCAFRKRDRCRLQNACPEWTIRACSFAFLQAFTAAIGGICPKTDTFASMSIFFRIF